MHLNEDLAFMGALLAKMRVELFHLQHTQVDYQTKLLSVDIRNEVVLLANRIHELAQLVESQVVDIPSTLKPMEVQAPLRTSSREILTKMRKFDGNESADEKIDFFH